MGQKTPIPKQKKFEPCTKGEEGDKSLEPDWTGFSASIRTSRMDSFGENDGTEAGHLEHKEIRSTETTKRG